MGARVERVKIAGYPNLDARASHWSPMASKKNGAPPPAPSPCGRRRGSVPRDPRANERAMEARACSRHTAGCRPLAGMGLRAHAVALGASAPE